MEEEIQSNTLSAQEFYDFCVLHNACDSGLKWIHGKSFQEFWDTCERGDWMLWFIWHKKDKLGWPLYWWNNKVARALEDEKKRADIEKRFQRLKNLNTMKIIFGQGDEQPEEVNG